MGLTTWLCELPFLIVAGCLLCYVVVQLYVGHATASPAERQAARGGVFIASAVAGVMLAAWAVLRFVVN